MSVVGLSGGYRGYDLRTGREYGETTLTMTAEATIDDDEVDAYTPNTWTAGMVKILFISRGTGKTLSPDQKAYILGFKNLNCMNRYIRRTKRKKEQERRRRMKEGAHHA